MTIKTFRARTLRDALAMVRAEFGPQAAVLHARELNAGPIARLLRGRGVEVAATPDHSPLAEQAAKSGALPGGASFRLPPPSGEGRGEGTAGTHSTPTLTLPLRGRESTPSASKATPDPLVLTLSELIAADIEPDLARSLLREATQRLPTQRLPTQRLGDAASSDRQRLRSAVAQSLSERVATTGPIAVTPGSCRVVALVGPTGVGKTTTLAKLAANFRLRDRVRVGLVTVDTFRVAAVEQLRTYAQIIDLPMEVVATPEEMRAAIDRLAGLDLVLVDTDGRSPRDTRHVEDLRRLLAEAKPHETHLVTSVAASTGALREAIDRFAVVEPTALLLTKLDEAPSMGHAASLLAESRLPISYLTDGQSVPEDIRVAERQGLARQLLGWEAA